MKATIFTIAAAIALTATPEDRAPGSAVKYDTREIATEIR